MISLRFTGGPLDGHTHVVATPAEEYRLGEGVYFRGRSRDRSAPGAETVDYSWRSEDFERWHSSDVEVVHMW